MSIVARVGGRLYTTVACTRLFSLAVDWSKLEKADAQISIGSVVLFCSMVLAQNNQSMFLLN